MEWKPENVGTKGVISVCYYHGVVADLKIQSKSFPRNKWIRKLVFKSAGVVRQVVSHTSMEEELAYLRDGIISYPNVKRVVSSKHKYLVIRAS